MNSRNENKINFLISVYKSILSKSNKYFFEYLNKVDLNKNIDGTEIYLKFINLDVDKTILLEHIDEAKKYNMQVQIHSPMLDNLSEGEILNIFKIYLEASESVDYIMKITLHPISKYNTDKENIEATKIIVNKILDYIKRHEQTYNSKIEILIENLDDLKYIQNSEYMLKNKRLGVESVIEIINDVNCSMTWDVTHNLLKEGNIGYNIIKNNIEKVNNIHISDINGNLGHMPYLYGKLDLYKITNFLSEIKYKGNIVTEIDTIRLNLDSYEKEIDILIEHVGKIKDIYNSI